jgi:ABC-type uncharacterized transport system substrate-binding protein
MKNLFSLQLSILARVLLAGMVFLSAKESVEAAGPRMRLFIVSSYHSEDLWSQETAAGVGKALLDFHFLDNERQVTELNSKSYIESSQTVIKKVWMDSKRKNSKIEIADATARIVNEIKVFHPDLILLSGDNATNYIGNNFIDREIPIVFCGINGMPLKYGLIDSIEAPGHNVTGIYQAGYIKESLDYLSRMIPDIKTLAVLSDDSETGRVKAKDLQSIITDEHLPIIIVEVVATNSYSEWKQAALRLSKQVDAFFVSNHNTLKDDDGRIIDQLEAGAWYLNNILKPDFSDERQFVAEGILLVVDDSGFKQGYEAVRTAQEILRKGKPPAGIAVRAPERGAVIVNRSRAAQLGIDLSNVAFIEEYIDKALCLESQSSPESTTTKKSGKKR